MLSELPKTEQRLRRKNACEKLVLVPGKLDHATVVAYNVGRYTLEDDKPTVRKATVKEKDRSRESSGSQVRVKKSVSSVGETRKAKVVMKSTKSDDEMNRNREEPKKDRTHNNDVEKEKRFETSL